MQPKGSTNSLRTCRRCLSLKPIEEFRPHPRSKYGTSSICSACNSEAQRRGHYADAPAGMKTCRECKVVKPYSEFYSSRGSGHLSNRCRACASEKAKRTFERLKANQRIVRQAKTCIRCGAEKKASEFYVRRASADWRDSVCIVCRRAESHPSGAPRSAYLRHKYSLTIAEFEALLRKQGGKCAICEVELDLSKKSRSATRCNIDHCHKGGSVRGLLCHACNVKLGAIESPGFLDAALAYLGKAGAENA